MTKNANQRHQDSLTRTERVGVFFTRQVGTMACAALFACIALISLPAAIQSGNLVIIIQWLSGNFLQLVLLSVIMVGSNVDSKHAEHLADATYEDTEEIKSMLRTLLLK